MESISIKTKGIERPNVREALGPYICFGANLSVYFLLKRRMRMEFTESSIQRSVNFLFPPTYVTFPNVNLFGWEMDLALVSTSYYLTEIEIKLVAQDWKRDINKMKWTEGYLIKKRKKYIKKFYYAIPVYLLPDIPKHVDHETGLIVIDEKGARIIREAVGQRTEKLEQRMITNLYKKMYHRNPWWDKR